jgi:hypothetical protein
MSREISLPIDRKTAWQLLLYGGALVVIGVLVVYTGWVASIPPFRSVVVNRVVSSFMAAVGAYVAATGAIRLVLEARGIAGVEFDRVSGLRSSVSGLRPYRLPVDEIAEFSPGPDRVAILPRDGRKRYVPLRALRTNLSPAELATAFEGERSTEE